MGTASVRCPQLSRSHQLVVGKGGASFSVDTLSPSIFSEKSPLLGDETQVGVPLPLGVPCSRLVVGGGGSSLVLVPFRTEKKSPFWGRRKNSVCISVISVLFVGTFWYVYFNCGFT